MTFSDRAEAGQKLAAILKNKGIDTGIVYALPRGGVILGYEIAKALNLPLETLIIKKIGHPQQPEYAIGAVSENGRTIFDQLEEQQLGPVWIKQAAARALSAARQRRLLYSAKQPPRNCRQQTAIITDDGAATGLSIELAIRELRRQQPARLIVALPVLPKELITKLAPLVDELVYLDAPDRFLPAVGAYYQNFDQIEDSQVIRLLKSLP
ncbi:MAG: phosphoribosyltransferase family protein [Candidatus Falkowbacteria bacterium]